MPEVDAFLNGFGFTKGVIIDGYKLISRDGSSTSIVRYRHYKYVFDLTFEKVSSGGSVDFQNKIKDMIHLPKTVLSAYGNPYYCVIDSVQFFDSDSKIRVKMEAKSTRT